MNEPKLEVRRSDGPYGAEILGIDTARPLTADTFAVIHRAFLDHVLIAISDIEENHDWLLDFGRRFGSLVPHALAQYHHPHSSDISIIAANMESDEARKTAKPAGSFWHSDLSYMAAPSDAIFLYSAIIPSRGGDTITANMYLAYDALHERTKSRIEGLTALHVWGWNTGGATPALDAELPSAEHPVVRVHPETGRKALFVSPGYTKEIVGMDPPESDEVLAELFDHATKPEFQYRHSWSLNQLVGLDNRASMHCAVADYTEPRRMLRMIVGCTG